jgi:hypothetical protein
VTLDCAIDDGFDFASDNYSEEENMLEDSDLGRRSLNKNV